MVVIFTLLKNARGGELNCWRRFGGGGERQLTWRLHVSSQRGGRLIHRTGKVSSFALERGVLKRHNCHASAVQREGTIGTHSVEERPQRIANGGNHVGPLR